jgi:hypothetical protein
VDGIRFDPTISLGNLVAAGSFVITVLVISTRLASRLSVIESRVGDLWKDFIDRRHRTPQT